MGAYNDIAKISSFLESAKSEAYQLRQDTGSVYNTSKRIDNFLSKKTFGEIQDIKDNLYKLLEDPLLPEDKLHEYTEILNYIG